jgi:hypothetical protein
MELAKAEADNARLRALIVAIYDAIPAQDFRVYGVDSGAVYDAIEQVVNENKGGAE